VPDYFLHKTCLRLMPPIVSATCSAQRAPLEWVSRALMPVRRDEVLRLRGVDEHFFLCYADRGLACRFPNAPLSVRCISEIAAVHVAARSTPITRTRRGALAPAAGLEYPGMWCGQEAPDEAAKSNDGCGARNG